jgi:hypothetical protein
LNRGFIGTLCLSVTFALLAGCGGSNPPIGASAASQGAATKAMAPRATSGALVYASNGCGGICVLSYPDGDLVSSITLTGDREGACSDSAGNVFITNDTQVVEYAYAGTTPIATLALPGNTALGCSVDPTTGNLAVTFYGNNVNVAIFPSATGQPTLYDAPFAVYCGYDAAGNLFLSGEKKVAELAKGHSDFQSFSIVGKVGNAGQIQWDGRYMTFESRTKGNIKLLRLQISGSTARVVGTTRLKSIRGNASQSWLYGDKILVPYGNGGQFETQIGVWAYPKGGKAKKRYRHFGTVSFHGVTVSVAPTR